MIRASFPFVSSAMCVTASLRVPMSPFFVLPGVAPQSIRMCSGPSSVGTVTRKKSPNPTRYIRIRRSPCFFPPPLISRTSMHEREVHLERVRIPPAREAEALAKAALVGPALVAEMSRDDIAHLRFVAPRLPLPADRFPHDQRDPAAKRKAAQPPARSVERRVHRPH